MKTYREFPDSFIRFIFLSFRAGTCLRAGYCFTHFVSIRTFIAVRDAFSY